MKTTINWLEILRNRQSKGRSIWVNIAYVFNTEQYIPLIAYMRIVNSSESYKQKTCTCFLHAFQCLVAKFWNEMKIILSSNSDLQNQYNNFKSKYNVWVYFVQKWKILFWYEVFPVCDSFSSYYEPNGILIMIHNQKENCHSEYISPNSKRIMNLFLWV